MSDLVHHFATMGFWSFEENVEREQTKGHVSIERITPTPLFRKIAPILLKERPLELWNLPLRSAEGERDITPGDPEYGDETWTPVPFFETFVDVFPEGQLQQTMVPQSRKWQDGTYVFKVSYDTKIWRKIAIDAKHTMEDLHKAIQRAFQFDNDHLYDFFLDGKKWSHRSVKSPNIIDHPILDSAFILTIPSLGNGQYADQVRVGELGLLKGETILYVFDYGDEWSLNVRLEKFRNDENRLSSPEIIGACGEAPQKSPTVWFW